MAYASGLSIGKEGPFVHIASILGSLLTKLPFFKYIRVNTAAYMQVLSAATAAGVCVDGAGRSRLHVTTHSAQT